MLIKVFGIWLVAANITHLTDTTDGCRVNFYTGGGYNSTQEAPAFVVIDDKECDRIATDINSLITLEAIK